MKRLPLYFWALYSGSLIIVARDPYVSHASRGMNFSEAFLFTSYWILLGSMLNGIPTRQSKFLATLTIFFLNVIYPLRKSHDMFDSLAYLVLTPALYIVVIVVYFVFKRIKPKG